MPQDEGFIEIKI